MHERGKGKKEHFGKIFSLIFNEIKPFNLIK
jgi:hypothetical protein